MQLCELLKVPTEAGIKRCFEKISVFEILKQQIINSNLAKILEKYM